MQVIRTHSIIDIVFILKWNFVFLHISSGPIDILILAGDDSITKWRQLMGPTKVCKSIHSHPDSIRGRFGLTDTRNACHGSDSIESAKREIGIFFPEFDVNDWLHTNSNSFTSEDKND